SEEGNSRMMINGNHLINILKTKAASAPAGHIFNKRHITWTYLSNISRSLMYMVPVILMILLTHSGVLAQRGTLKGIVADKTTGEIVPFSTVAVIEAGKEEALMGGVSNDDGR